MKIVLPRNELLKQLFPQLQDFENISEKDISVIKKAYSLGSYQPDITVKEHTIVISFDEDFTREKSDTFNKVVQLCETGEYDSALKIINELIDKKPTIAEYYRIKGQILSDQGYPSEAIDELIEAVRLDPENESALIMLGNIYARNRSDTDTAITFYERVLKTNPGNYLAINNIGSNLAKLGQHKEAKRYFELAKKENPDYPNTIYGLALVESKLSNPRGSFDYSVELFSKLKPRNNKELYKQNLNLIQEESRKIMRGGDLAELISPYKQQLEQRGEKEIRVEASSTITTPAKIEIAEVHGRNFHLVKYQPEREAVAHLVMHELGHLDRQLHARAIGQNKLFTTDRDNKKKFNYDHQHIAGKLKKRGLPESKIGGFLDQIFQGLNNQLYNTPVDLFIERKLFDDFPELRPYQFISLLQLEQEYIESATNKDIQKLVSKKITHVNKVLSLVNTLQFRELYGIDLTSRFKPTKEEKEEAEKLYKEWLAYFNDDKYALEYELINLWAEDFGLTNYFTLVDEEQQTESSLDETVDQIEEDPLSLDDDEDIGEESFSNENAPAGQMAATMYIVDALQYFENKSIDEIRKIGFEIGMLGRSGIDTDNPEKKYSLKSIPNKKFSGRHLLAYMYTAFKEFEPNMDTGINFDEEYKQAKELYEKGL